MTLGLLHKSQIPKPDDLVAAEEEKLNEKEKTKDLT